MIRIDVPDDAVAPGLLDQALAGRAAALPSAALLAWLAETGRGASDSTPLLQAVVADAGVEPPLRAGALGVLSRTAPAAAVATAVDLVRDGNDLLAARAALALGRLGGAEHLELLAELRHDAGGPLARDAAAFAETLLAHRYQVDDRDLAASEAGIVAAPPGTGSIPLVSVRPGVHRRAEALHQVNAVLPWVDPANHDVREIQCGPRLVEVLVKASLSHAAGRRDLSRHRTVPAVVALRSVGRDGFDPAMVVLSSPGRAPGQLELLVTRLTGEPVYIGEGTVSDTEVKVALRAVRTPGAASIAVQVRVDDAGLEVAGVAGRTAVEPPRAPQRLGT